MTDYRHEPGFVDDDEIAESIRHLEQERSLRVVLVVLGMIAALAIGSTAIYLAYTDQPATVREIEAAQPGGR